MTEEVISRRETRRVRSLLSGLLTNLTETLIGTVPLNDQVELGQTLWRISRQVNRLLSPLKEALREESLARSRGLPGSQFLQGRHLTSRCTVTVPAATVRLREGVTESQLRDLLGDRFDSYFRVSSQVLTRKGFQELIAAEDQEVLGALVTVLDSKSDPPRVTFND